MAHRRRTTVLVIVGVMALALVAASVAVASWVLNKEARAKQFLMEARALADDGEFARAAIQYQNAIKYDEDNVAALSELADLYVSTDDLNSAYKYYRLASEKDPKNVEVLSKLAECYYIAGRWDDVRKIAARIVSLAPGGAVQAKAHNYLGQAYYVDTDYEKAAEQFAKVSRYDGTNLDAVLSLALVQAQHLANAPEAQLALETLLELYADEAAPADRRAEAALRAAKFYQATSQRSRAEEFFKSALTLQGERSRYWLALGDFYKRGGRDRQNQVLAEEAYLKALEVESDDPRAFMSLGLFYKKSGRTDKAIEVFAKGIATEGARSFHQAYYQHLIEAHLARNDVDAARTRLAGLRQMKNSRDTGDYLEGRILLSEAQGVDDKLLAAEKYFTRVTKAKPRFPNAYYYLGLCLATRGLLDDAAVEFQRTLALSSHFPEASIALGETYMRTREFDKAAGYATTVLANDPDNFMANLIAGRAMLAMGKLTSAANFLEQASSLQPASVEPYVALANLHARQGEKQKALEVLDEAERVTDEPSRIKSARAMVLSALGDEDEALGIASGLAEADPADAGPARFYASLLWRGGRRRDAIDFIAGRIERYPAGADYRNLMGDFQRALGEYPGALASYAAALEAFPSDRKALTGSAESLLAMGRLEHAREMIRRLEQADPGSPTSDLLEARVLEAEGKLDAAAALLSNSLRQNSTNAEAHFHLAMIRKKRGELSKAIESLRLCLKYNPASVAARLALAENYYKTRYFDDALREVKVISASGELDSSTLEQVTKIATGSLLSDHRVEDAIDEWMKLPANARVGGAYQLKLGYLHLLNRDLDAAGEAFNEAAGLLGDPAMAHEGLARLAVARGELDEAHRQVLLALEGESDGETKVRVLQIKASVALAMDREDEASEALDAAIEAAGDSAMLLVQAADACYALRERDLAIETYRLAVAADGAFAPARRRLASALISTGRFKEAEAVANELIAGGDDGGFSALVLKGRALFGQGRLDEAAELVGRAISLPSARAGTAAAARHLLGEINYRQKLWPAAETELRRAIAEDPHLLEARLLLAKVLMRTGSNERAAIEAREILKQDPDNPQGYAILADTAMLAGRSEEALLNYRKSLALDRNKAALIALMQTLKRLGRSDEAAGELEDYIGDDLSDADLVWMLASSHLARGDLEGAARVLARALEANGPAERLVWLLADVYRRQGKFDRAVTLIARTIEREPTPQAYRTLAGLYAIEGKNDLAERAFRDGIEAFGAFLPNHLDLAALLASGGDEKGAIEVLRSGIEANGGDESFHEALAGFLLRLGREREAVDHIIATLGARPAFANLSSLLGDYYYSKGKLDSALEYYQKALKYASGKAMARAANGAAYVMTERNIDLRRALELAEKADLAQPDDPAILDTLGWACYKNGHYNKAVVNLARAVKLSGATPPGTLYHLALAYREAGMVANAKDTLSELLELDPSWRDNEEVKVTLALE